MGQRLRRRPAEPMPAQIEQPDRQPAIDPCDAVRQTCRFEAILPRAGEHGELAACALRETTRDRVHESMRVLPYAAALAERRPVVDQDSHLFKSFRISILF